MSRLSNARWRSSWSLPAEYAPPVSTHPSEPSRGQTKQEYSRDFITLSYALLHIPTLCCHKIQIIVLDHLNTSNKEVTTFLVYDNIGQIITFNDIFLISPLVTFHAIVEGWIKGLPHARAAHLVQGGNALLLSPNGRKESFFP